MFQFLCTNVKINLAENEYAKTCPADSLYAQPWSEAIDRHPYRCIIWNFEIRSGGKALDVYVNYSRLLHQLIQTSNIREISVKGPLSNKAFIDSSGKRAGYSTRIQARSLLLWRIDEKGVLVHQYLATNAEHKVQELAKYELMKKCYENLEDRNLIISGKYDPDKIYKIICSLHYNIYKDSKDKNKMFRPYPPQRDLKALLENEIVKRRKLFDVYNEEDVSVKASIIETSEVPAEYSNTQLGPEEIEIDADRN